MQVMKNSYADGAKDDTESPVTGLGNTSKPSTHLINFYLNPNMTQKFTLRVSYLIYIMITLSRTVSHRYLTLKKCMMFLKML